MSQVLHKPPAPDLEELVREVTPGLLAYIRAHSIRNYNVEELLQETLVRILQRYRRDRPSEGRFTAWMFAAARHVVIEFCHLRAHDHEVVDIHPSQLIVFVDCSESRVIQVQRLLRDIGKIVQSAFNELRGRATFRLEMALTRFDMLAIQRTWYLLHGAHPPRLQAGSAAADLSEPAGMMCSRFAPAQ